MEWHTIIGLLGAAGTTFAFVPQALRVIKSKKTEDISLAMYIIFVFGIICWLIYGIIIKDLPIICANVVSLCLSSLILVLKIKYK